MGAGDEKVVALKAGKVVKPWKAYVRPLYPYAKGGFRVVIPEAWIGPRDTGVGVSFVAGSIPAAMDAIRVWGRQCLRFRNDPRLLLGRSRLPFRQ